MKTANAPRTYTNVMLTLVAGLLAISVLGRATSLSSTAFADTTQPEEGSGLVSAAEQRKAMISELKAIASRLDRLDATMSKVLNVKVLEMPPVKLQGGAPKP